MESIKNFLALIISTITWIAGLGGVFLLLSSIITLDFLVLILSAIAFILLAAGLLIGRYNERVKVALEFPFGFFTG